MTTYTVDGWSALGDPTRRAIFGRLVTGPLSVGELARDLPISRPAVSQHLRVLREAGLVVAQRAGNRNIYAVDREGLADLRAELDRYWNDTLSGYKLAVERSQRGEE